MLKSGDSEAMNKIINDNVGLVWNVVKRFSNRGYELEDLFQVGSVGFVKAIKRFNTEYETQLSTYAVSMIIGEIRRFLRDDGIIKVSRSLKETATKIREFRERFPDKDFSIDELSETLNLDKEDIVLALDASASVESLDRNINDDMDGKTIGENIASKQDEYNELMDKITINSLLNVLDEKERKVIIYRYYKDMTQCKIAELCGTSQVQISRIEKKALSKMKAVLI